MLRTWKDREKHTSAKGQQRWLLLFDSINKAQYEQFKSQVKLHSMNLVLECKSGSASGTPSFPRNQHDALPPEAASPRALPAYPRVPSPGHAGRGQGEEARPRRPHDSWYPCRYQRARPQSDPRGPDQEVAPWGGSQEGAGVLGGSVPAVLGAAVMLQGRQPQLRHPELTDLAHADAR